MPNPQNALKQFVGFFLCVCLCVFDHFVGLVLKGLTDTENSMLGGYI